MSASKKNLASLEVRERFNSQTGEIEESLHSTAFKAEAEPNYIKLYLEDLAYFHKLPKSLPDIIYQLLPLVNYQQQIVITSYHKREIANTLSVTPAHINNAITKLTQAEVLIRIDRGVYELNSYLFGKGSWKDIIKHRKSLKLEVFYDFQCGKSERKITTSTVNPSANNLLTKMDKVGSGS